MKKVKKTLDIVNELTRDLTSVGYMNSKSYHRERLLSFAVEMFNRGGDNMAIAFGGCKSCYGKGYNTVLYSEQWGGDFLGDKSGSTPMRNNIVPCKKCSRGKEIKKILKGLPPPQK